LYVSLKEGNEIWNDGQGRTFYLWQEDFTDFFKQDVAGVISLSESAFIIKYKEGMRPQVQIAKNQGFVTGWVL
jgi:hypothetical protein